MGRVVLELVKPAVSPETVDLLALTLQAAERGDVIGVALIMMHPGWDYTIDIAGMVREDPTFCRGMVQKLNDELAKLDLRTP